MLFVLPTWLLLACMAVAPSKSMELSILLGDYVHLKCNQSAYDAIVQESRQPEGTRFVRIDWGGFGLNPVDLVYDESREIDLPTHLRSKEWQEKVGPRSEFMTCQYNSRSLSGYYYAVRFSC